MNKYMIAILAVSISALAACGGGAEGGEGAKTPESGTTSPGGDATGTGTGTDATGTGTGTGTDATGTGTGTGTTGGTDAAGGTGTPKN
jgi:hypothetical protein